MLNETVDATSLLSGIDSFPMEGLGSSLDAFRVLTSDLVCCGDFGLLDLEIFDPTIDDFFLIFTSTSVSCF